MSLIILLKDMDTFIIIEIITMVGLNLITDTIVVLFDFNTTVVGFVYTLISPLLVITRMHYIFLAINLQKLAAPGYVTWWPIEKTANFI